MVVKILQCFLGGTDTSSIFGFDPSSSKIIMSVNICLGSDAL